MRFEVGKYYKHSTGKIIHIVGGLQTTMYGGCLVAEEAGYGNLLPIGQDEDATQNWREITEIDWLRNFR